MSYELGIIGGGNMAEAILHGVLTANVLHAEAILVSEPLPNRREHVHELTHVECVDNNHAAAACPRVLLAVKPQMMAQVLETIAAEVSEQTLVISIAAGVTTARLDEFLRGHGRIVRVMPNTPMLAGMGMSALAAGPRATDEDLAWAKRLFAASGKTCIVPENLMDAVTAVSGSGPAYFFYLIEAMVEAGIAEGLDHATARMLAVQTCVGSALLLEQTGQEPQVLRARVTSPKGTTQCAIETMDAAGVKEALVRAVRAAAARSKELGK